MKDLIGRKVKIISDGYPRGKSGVIIAADIEVGITIVDNKGKVLWCVDFRKCSDSLKRKKIAMDYRKVIIDGEIFTEAPGLTQAEMDKKCPFKA